MLKGQVKLHIIQLLYLILIKLFLVVERRVRLIFFYLHKIFAIHIFIISFIKGWPFDLESWNDLEFESQKSKKPGKFEQKELKTKNFEQFCLVG